MKSGESQHLAAGRAKNQHDSEPDDETSASQTGHGSEKTIPIRIRATGEAFHRRRGLANTDRGLDTQRIRWVWSATARLNPSKLRAVCVSHPYGTAADASKHELILFTSKQHRNQFYIQSGADINFPLRSTALIYRGFFTFVRAIVIMTLLNVSMFMSNTCI